MTPPMVPRRHKVRHWWTTRERALVRLHYGPHAREPWPTPRLAEALGRSEDDVRAAGRRYGMSAPPQKKPTRRFLLALYGEGLDDVWIAAVAGVSHDAVFRWRKREGLPPRKRGGAIRCP